MTPFRPLLRDRRDLAGWLFALALLLKLLVPAGFMPVAAGEGVRLEICTGMGVAPAMATAAAMPGMAHHGDPAHAAGKADQPCGFGGLFASGLGDAPVVATAIALAATEWRSRASTPSTASPPARLRPPPHGPPASV